jgi:hypothetical protein
VNGEIVSEKRSITGEEHLFKITENGIDNSYKLTTGINLNGVSFCLYKNDKAVIEMPNSKFAFYFSVIIGAILGYLIMSR